ncbi:hypothetical protein BJS_01462 [Bradyrhizobium japonicum SEMIA 5079]|nr:hypothetical protein BJS_01462 [Bradyrhizobium japonicum SEMIA 5079]
MQSDEFSLPARTRFLKNAAEVRSDRCGCYAKPGGGCLATVALEHLHRDVGFRLRRSKSTILLSPSSEIHHASVA